VKKRRSLSVLLSLALVAIAVSPLALTALLLGFLLNPALVNQQQQNQATIALSVSGQISAYLEKGATEINFISAYVNELENSLDMRQMNVISQQANLFKVIYLVDENGIVQLAGVPENSKIVAKNLLKLDVSKMPYFSNLQKGSHWHQSFLSSVSGELVAAYTQDLSEQSKYRYLIGELSIDSLPKILKNISTSSGQTVMILDEANQLIGHADRNLSSQQLNLSNLALLQQASNTIVSGELEFLGNNLHGTLIQLDDPNWRIIVAISHQKFWKLRNTGLMTVLISLLVAVLFSIITARLVSKHAFSLFSMYSNIAKELSSGHHKMTTPITGIYELDQFGENLKKTGQEIAEREAELEEINEELEHRVKERTLDLSHSNDFLNMTLEKLKKAQSELIDTEKLAALGSLVAGVAHELNTPIGVGVTASTTLLAETDLLEKSYQDKKMTESIFLESIEQIKSGAYIISRNLDRAAVLVASFKQVAVDQSSDQRRIFDLNELLQDVIFTLTPKYKKRNIAINLMIQNGVELDSYPGSLVQIVSNLIDNAINHGYENSTEGTVSVQAKALNSESVNILVIDYGAGISTEIADRIFEPFFTTRLGKGGSGLGLNICHSIAKKILGGSITHSDTQPNGSTFCITIPLIAPVNDSVDE